MPTTVTVICASSLPARWVRATPLKSLLTLAPISPLRVKRPTSDSAWMLTSVLRLALVSAVDAALDVSITSTVRLSPSRCAFTSATIERYVASW